VEGGRCLHDADGDAVADVELGNGRVRRRVHGQGSGNKEPVSADVVKRGGATVYEVATGRGTQAKGHRVVEADVDGAVITAGLAVGVDGNETRQGIEVARGVADIARVCGVACEVGGLNVGGEVDGGGVELVEVQGEVHVLADGAGAGPEELARVVVLVLETGNVLGDIYVGSDKHLEGAGGLLGAGVAADLAPFGDRIGHRGSGVGF